MNQIHYFINKTLLFILIFLIFCNPIKANLLEKNHYNKYLQITSEINQVSSFDLSKDGKYLVYSTTKDGFSDLWLRSADPNIIVLPKRLTNSPSIESAPVFSPDGNYIAYVSLENDVKGDIYLLNLKTNEKQRLTNKTTEDGAPCFSHDGKSLYFHISDTLNLKRKIVSINLQTKNISYLDIKGDGAFPKISSDGSKLLFISYRNDKNGDIFLYDFNSKSVRELSSGPYIDLYPTWSDDGKKIYFSRYGLDTNLDGKINTNDNSSIYKIDFDDKYFHPIPLTNPKNSCFLPVLNKNRLVFISNKGGINNCWSLPDQGIIPDLKNTQEQIDLAFNISNMIPKKPFYSICAFYKVLDLFPENTDLCAKSIFEIGNLYESLNMTDAALSIYEIIINNKWPYNISVVQPESGLSNINYLTIIADKKLQNTANKYNRKKILYKQLKKFKQFCQNNNSIICAKSKLERSRLISKYTNSYNKAISLLDTVIRQNSYRKYVAEAMILKADIYAIFSQLEIVIPFYIKVIEKYSDLDKITDTAVNKCLNLILNSMKNKKLEDKISILKKYSDKYNFRAKAFSIGALNKVGDLYYEADELSKAKNAYKEVLNNYKEISIQTTASRLSLAEILYKQERFSEALNLYEKEIVLRNYEDDLYKLARLGYIRKSLAAGEYLYRFGEILAARNNFKELIDYDYNICEAHRGYIKCAAAINSIDSVLGIYEKKLEKNKNSEIDLYAKALCLTYKNNKSDLKKSEKILQKVISINGQVEYYHQTMAYVLEVLETVYGETDNLEKALNSYQKALFLNDQNSNPENRAHLIQNIGNINYLSGQYSQALNAFDQRQNSQVPFDNINTEIVFYKRMGEAAFQARDYKKSINSLNKALELINSSIDPKKASEKFENISRFVFDHVLTPALKDSDYKSKAYKLAQRQSDINSSHFAILQTNIKMPPSDEWNQYIKVLKDLLKKQKKLNKYIISLGNKISKKNQKINKPSYDDIESELDIRVAMVEKYINHPKNIIDLKAEIIDRLALSYQENGDFEKASKNFTYLFELNQKSGNTKNLYRNKRSIAYNTYMQAGISSGKEKSDLLEKSKQDFKDVLKLVDKYGVIEKKKKSNAFFNLSFQASIDKTAQTHAAYGFSKDQEKRLCHAFLSKIYIEEGLILNAKKEFDRQLEQYHDLDISNSDIFGLALLFHRSGHVEYALKNYETAFIRFKNSLTLALKMNSPVSASINLTNMALILSKISFKSENYKSFQKEIMLFDKSVSRLLYEKKDVLGGNIPAIYHNKMGVYTSMFYDILNDNNKNNGLFNFFKKDSEEPAKDIYYNINQIYNDYTSVIHFQKALNYLKNEKQRLIRKDIALWAAINLNIARIAKKIGDDSGAKKHYETALKLSEKAYLPSIKWRALSGLNKKEKALETLNNLTILNAHANEFEIQKAFSQDVLKLVNEDKIEDAFNLVEKISEIERFNRLAFLFQNFSSNELSIYKSIYPHIQRIQKLKKQNSKNQDYLKNSINLELELIASKAGNNYEKLSSIVRLIKDDNTRDTVIILIGIAAHAEEIADQNIFQSDLIALDDNKSKNKLYVELINEYIDIRNDYFDKKSSQNSTDILTFFNSNQYEAIDVMENIDEKHTMIRIFQVEKSQFIVFNISQDNISASIINSLDKLQVQDNQNIICAFEKPELLFNNEKINWYALSASHYIRALNSKKPFKRGLKIFDYADKIKYTNNEYDYIDFDLLNGNNFKESNFSSINTLLCNNNISINTKIPLKQGNISKKYFNLNIDDNKNITVDNLLNNSDNLNLAILADFPLNDIYEAGHIFSIFNCPSVIIPITKQENNDFIYRFLDESINKSSLEALQTAKKESNSKAHWILLGANSMNSKEALNYSIKYFTRYVKQAILFFNKKEYSRSMELFDQAIKIAKITNKFSPYLSTLYNFASDNAYYINQYDKALKYQKSNLEIIEESKPSTNDHAQGLLKFGLIYAKMEKYDLAVPYLEKAALISSELNSKELQIKILEDFGIVLENSTNYDRALVNFKTAAKLGQKINKNLFMAAQFKNIARIYDLRLSNYPKALNYYQKSLGVYKKIKDYQKCANLYLDIGRTYRLMGIFPKAEKNYTHAVNYLAKDNDNIIKAKIIIEQANNAWYQGQYEEAFIKQRKALEISSKYQYPLIKIICFNTSGLIWWTLGNNEKALKELNKALSLARDFNQRKDEIATSLNNLGLIYRSMGDYKKALTLFNEALEIDQQIKSKWAIAYDYRNIGILYMKMEKLDDAVDFLNKACKIAHSIGNKINEAKTLQALGDAYFQAQKYETAKEIFSNALSLSNEMNIKETMWRSLFGLAKIELMNDRLKAKKMLMNTINIIENMRADIKIMKLKDSFISDKLDVYETLIALLIESGESISAFEYSERSRARNFIDLLGNQKIGLNNNIDQELYNRILQTKNQILENETLLSQTNDEKSKKLYSKMLSSLKDNLNDLMLDVESKNPELSSLVTVKPLKTNEIQKIIDQDTCLLSYYVLKDQIFCWIIKNNNIQIEKISINKNVITNDIMEYRRMIQNIEPLEFQSKKLYKILISPILDKLENIKNIGIIPHNCLHYLSFATLLNEEYLIDNYSIFYLPNASVLNYTIKKRFKQKNVKVLAIGNPYLGDPIFDLPFAIHEVGSIRWNFPEVTILEKEKATEYWVVNNIHKYGIIHMATHGEFDPINPLFSSVKLSKTDKYDGNLNANEVFGLRIRADMVVLSACQTGLGKIKAGDELIGLNRAFFYAGTHTVISSLWRVSDISTAVLIKTFYRQYLYHNKADSLRLAVLHVKKQYPHPGYWGAFSLVGDYY